MYRNFHNYECYKDMQHESNQSARLHKTNKTNNFETLEDITIVNLKFRPIIYETGTFTPVCLKLLKQKIVEKTCYRMYF